MKALCCAIRVAAVEQCTTVAGAFQKIDFADHRLQQVFIIKHQRLTNQSMDYEFMTSGIYCRNAGMMRSNATVRCNGSRCCRENGMRLRPGKRLPNPDCRSSCACRPAAVRVGTRPGVFDQAGFPILCQAPDRSRAAPWRVRHHRGCACQVSAAKQPLAATLSKSSALFDPCWTLS